MKKDQLYLLFRINEPRMMIQQFERRLIFIYVCMEYGNEISSSKDDLIFRYYK